MSCLLTLKNCILSCSHVTLLCTWKKKKMKWEISFCTWSSELSKHSGAKEHIIAIKLCMVINIMPMSLGSQGALQKLCNLSISLWSFIVGMGYSGSTALENSISIFENHSGIIKILNIIIIQKTGMLRNIPSHDIFHRKYSFTVNKDRFQKGFWC